MREKREKNIYGPTFLVTPSAPFNSFALHAYPHNEISPFEKENAMFERASATARKRAYRRRLRDGLVVLRLEIREADLAEALLAAGRLDNAAALARGELEHAAEDV